MDYNDGWDESESHWRDKERQKIVAEILSVGLKYAVMSDPKSLHFSMACEEIADHIEASDT